VVYLTRLWSDISAWQHAGAEFPKRPEKPAPLFNGQSQAARNMCSPDSWPTGWSRIFCCQWFSCFWCVLFYIFFHFVLRRLGLLIRCFYQVSFASMMTKVLGSASSRAIFCFGSMCVIYKLHRMSNVRLLSSIHFPDLFFTLPVCMLDIFATSLYVFSCYIWLIF